jgi:hypothetical protein
MKKAIAILLIISLFSCSKPKPEGIVLKVVYQPEKTYQISTIRGAETVITYSGEDIAMRKLKSMHVKNPTISKVKTKTDAELVTGKIMTGASYQVSLKYKKTMSLDGKNEIPVGTVVTGKITDKKLPTFNSVTSGVLNYDQKALILQTVRTIFEQLDFPERRLKTGDQFSINRPVTMSMEGSVIETVVSTTYKLLEIKNGMAQFELSQSYQMTPKIMDNSFRGNGSGKGRLTYDIENCMVPDYSIKTELVMNKKLDYFEFDLKTMNEFSQTTQIGKQ